MSALVCTARRIAVSVDVYGASVDVEPERTELLLHPRAVVACALPSLDYSHGDYFIAVNCAPITKSDVYRRRLVDGDVVSVYPTIGDLGVTAIVLSVATAAFSVASTFLFPPELPDLPAEQEKNEESNSRGFQNQQTTVGPGQPIPVVYGRLRVGGHIIETAESIRYQEAKPPGGTHDPSTVTVIPQSQVASLSGPVHFRVAWCLGPIQSVSSIEFDGNPIEDVKGTKYETVLGTTRQQWLTGFDETKVQNPTGTTLPQSVTVAGGAHTVTTASEVDTVEIGIQFDAGLYKRETNDTFTEVSVQIRFSWKRVSEGSYSDFDTLTFYGRQENAFTHWVRLPMFDHRGQYDIKVERISADTTGDTHTAFTWTDIIEVDAGKSAHPGLAQTGFRNIATDQIPIPRNITAIVEGKSNIRIYSGSNAYTEGWTDNPAWCAADFITGEHGMGRWYTYDDLDIDAFVNWAKYCDEQVDDLQGINTTHARCSLDYEMKERRGGREMLKIFETAGDAWIVEQAGRWTVVIDRKAKMKKIFTEGNYVEDSMAYTFIDRTEHPNRITARFQNEDKDYTIDELYQEDESLALGEKLVNETTDMFGIAREAQIARTLARKVAKLKAQKRGVEFAVGLNGINLKAGDVIGVGSMAGVSSVATGRLRSVSSDLLTLGLDYSAALVASSTYGIAVLHQIDGVVSEKRLVNVPTGSFDFVQVGNSAWSRQPQAGDVFAIGLMTEIVEKFRITRTTLEGGLTRTIRGIQYDETVYDAAPTIDVTSTVAARRLSRRIIPDPVVNLVVSTKKVDTVHAIDISWDLPGWDVLVAGTAPYLAIRPSGARSPIVFKIFWRKATDNQWVFASSVEKNGVRLPESLFQASTAYIVRIVAATVEGYAHSLDDAPEASFTTGA